METINLILNRSFKMAKKLATECQRRVRELPRIVLIPVPQELYESDSRKEDVRQILARMFVLSRKRGRRRKGDSNEVVAA